MRAAQAAKRLLKTFQEARESKSFFEKIREFKPHIEINIESGDFLVTTAQSSRELHRILELRHEIFVWEWQGRKAFHRLDVDDYDFEGDHLMIIDKRSDKVIGTYRMLCTKFARKFYSDSEFDIAEFLASPGVKLEVGRACVHQDYRDGSTIDLLWKGIAAYIHKSGSEMLFGCSSVKSMDAKFISSLYKYFAGKEQWTDSFNIRAREKYVFPEFDLAAAAPLSAAEMKESLPPLLRSYLNGGARVFGEPALDRDFECTDLFTILEMSRINKKMQARYLGT